MDAAKVQSEGVAGLRYAFRSRVEITMDLVPEKSQITTVQEKIPQRAESREKENSGGSYTLLALFFFFFFCLLSSSASGPGNFCSAQLVDRRADRM